MLTREQAIQIINEERAYQDRTYDPNAVLSSGLTRATRDMDVTSHIVMLSSYVHRAADKWTWERADNLPALKEIAKIAAVAIRALERSGGSHLLLTSGLR